MNNQEFRKFILESAFAAPSGDNLQPWRLRWEDSSLVIFACNERRFGLFGKSLEGFFISIGALIENVVIAAASRGVEATPEVCEAFDPKLSVARIYFRVTGKVSDADLAGAIQERRVNRFPYRKEKLSALTLAKLEELGGGNEEVHAALLADPRQRNEVASVINCFDQLRFSNRVLHETLHRHITYGEIGPEGMPIQTICPNRIDGFLFRRMRPWRVMRALTFLAVHKFMAKIAMRLCREAPILWTLSVRNKNPGELIAAGRVLERLWLRCEVEGLALQPMCPIPYLRHALGAATETFSENDCLLIRQCDSELNQLINPKHDATWMMICRIGYPTRRPPKSGRRNVEGVLQQSVTMLSNEVSVGAG